MKRRSLQLLLLLIFRAAVAQAGPPSGGTRPDDTGALVKLLVDEAKRDDAACKLIRMQSPGELADDEACRVNHVIVAPQKSGGPLYVVFVEAAWCDYDGPGLA
jgi:hypothetical protein